MGIIKTQPSGKAVVTVFTPAPPVSANATKTGKYWRDAGTGEALINYRIAWSGANGGAGAAYKLPLPTGLTFDQTRYSGTFDGVEQTCQKFETGGEFFNSGTNIEMSVAMAFDGSTFAFDLPFVGLMTDDRPGTNDVLDVTIRCWVNGSGF